MILLIDAVLILVFALFTGSLLKLPTKPAALLGLFLLAYANIIVVSQLAATIHLLDYRVFLAFHLILALLAWSFWHRAGEPSLMGPFSNFILNLNKNNLAISIKTRPELWVLGLGVVVVYLIGIILILIVPPNTHDSMTYHLSRVGYWLQHNSFYPWPTANLRQTTFPMNAEIGILWTVLLWETDQLAGFGQWLAVPVSMVAIAGLAHLLGGTRTQSVFAALIWATLTEILLQATTTQNDLVASAFFVSMLYLLYLGLQSNQSGVLLLSGLALGQAIGTKSTVLLLLPGLALTVIVLWFSYGQQGFRQFVVWTGASLAGIILMGTYILGLNFLAYGYPLGPSSFVSYITASPVSRLELLTTNTARYLYQAVDLTGLPNSIAAPLQETKDAVAAQLFSLLNIPIGSTATTWQNINFDLYQPAYIYVHEDIAWFGPLVFLLLMPAIVSQTFSGIRKKEPFRLGLVFIALGFLLSHSLLQPWTPYKNRYYVLIITICAPFFALFFRSGYLFGLLRWGIIGLALLVMGWTASHNWMKPLVGPYVIWRLDAIDRRTINQRQMESVLRAVATRVPGDATIGLLLGENDWDYPFFGPHFERRVMHLAPPPSEVTFGTYDEYGLDFLIIREQFKSRLSLPPDAVQQIGDGWYLVDKTDVEP